MRELEWQTISFQSAPPGWRLVFPKYPDCTGCEEYAMPGWLTQRSFFTHEEPNGYCWTETIDDPSIRVIASLVEDGEVLAADEDRRPYEVLGPGELLTPVLQEQLLDRKRRMDVNEEARRRRRQAQQKQKPK